MHKHRAGSVIVDLHILVDNQTFDDKLQKCSNQYLSEMIQSLSSAVPSNENIKISSKSLGERFFS